MRMGKNVKIEFSAGAALLLGALYFVLDWDGLGALLLAAAAHEAGHFAALRLTGGRVSGVRADVCGAVIERRGAVSLWGEVFCAAAGPLAGGLYALLVSRLGLALSSELLTVSAGMSLVLSVFNLIPATPLDGGRIAGELLSRRAADALALAASGLVLAAGLVAVARGRGAALLCAGAYLCLQRARES